MRDCLISLRGRVDEVVVVDTGSTDDTVSIAQENGARVLEFPWNGSFSDARNVALDACRGDWILYIDADERLSLDDDVHLASLLMADEWAGATVRFRPKTGYTRYWEQRLFRNHPEIRFQGKIHETHVPSMTAFARRHGLGIGKVNACIDHYGYDGDQSHKHPRNLPLLRESVTTNPERIYYWYHLSETLAALGRTAEALETGERGLARAAAAGKNVKVPDANTLAYTVARLRMEQGLDPSDVIEDALQRDPQDHAMAFLKAQHLVRTGKPGMAMSILDTLLSIDPARLDPGRMAFDERIFGDLAREVKAAALVRLGDLEGAGMLLRKAPSAPNRRPG